MRSLQSGAITAGLPFSLILLFICWNLHRALTREFRVPGARRAANAAR